MFGFLTRALRDGCPLLIYTLASSVPEICKWAIIFYGMFTVYIIRLLKDNIEWKLSDERNPVFLLLQYFS